jgi:hypothetical protein
VAGTKYLEDVSGARIASRLYLYLVSLTLGLKNLEIKMDIFARAAAPPQKNFLLP